MCLLANAPLRAVLPCDWWVDEIMTDSHRSHLQSPVWVLQHWVANYVYKSDPPESGRRKGRPDSKMTVKKDTFVMKVLHGFVISSCITKNKTKKRLFLQCFTLILLPFDSYCHNYECFTLDRSNSPLLAYWMSSCAYIHSDNCWIWISWIRPKNC